MRLSARGHPVHSHAEVCGLSEGRPRLRRKRSGLLWLVVLAAMPSSCDVSDEGLFGTVFRRDGGVTRSAPRAAGDAGAAPGAGPSTSVEGPAAGDAAAPAPPAGGPLPPPIDAPPPTAVAVARTALLLVGEQPLSMGDTIVSRRLSLLGFQVTVHEIAGAAAATAAVEAARGYALVVLTSSVPAGTGVARQTGEVPVPMLCSSAGFFDDLGISQENEEGAINPGEIQLRIVAPEHPLAAGRAGVVRVARVAGLFGSAQTVPGATPIATLLGDDDEVGIVGLERGAPGAFGPAPARRVGWFALEQTFPALTPDGWALFDAAVRWLIAPPPP